jgi:hypothetical protein
MVGGDNFRCSDSVFCPDRCSWGVGGCMTATCWCLGQPTSFPCMIARCPVLQTIPTPLLRTIPTHCLLCVFSAAVISALSHFCFVKQEVHRQLPPFHSNLMSCRKKGSKDDGMFDRVIGEIEGMLMDEGFAAEQDAFIGKGLWTKITPLFCCSLSHTSRSCREG